MSTLDPITTSVVEHALASVTDEMATVLISTAYSPLVRDLLDFAVVLCNPRGEMVVQGLGMAIHLSALPTAIEAILREFSGDMRPGDAIIMNDPYEGGMHPQRDYSYPFRRPRGAIDRLSARSSCRRSLSAMATTLCSPPWMDSSTAAGVWRARRSRNGRTAITASRNSSTATVSTASKVGALSRGVFEGWFLVDSSRFT